MALYTHPSVTSTITDASQVFVTSQGLTGLFCPHFSEKGKDRVLMIVDGPGDDDYVDKHGSPSYLKFGQAQLNTIQWVKSGGTAYTMRITPPDAKYAHAILCFQIKDVDVTKWQKGGEDVTRVVNEITGEVSFILPDGTSTITKDEVEVPITTEDDLTTLGCTTTTENRKLVRTRVKKVPAGVTEVGQLDAWVESNHNDILEDGYTQYVLGYFVVEGRGADYYNDFSFKISLNEDLDDTYSFRVYEVSLLRKLPDNSFMLLHR